MLRGFSACLAPDIVVNIEVADLLIVENRSVMIEYNARIPGALAETIPRQISQFPAIKVGTNVSKDFLVILPPFIMIAGMVETILTS